MSHSMASGWVLTVGVESVDHIIASGGELASNYVNMQIFHDIAALISLSAIGTAGLSVNWQGSHDRASWTSMRQILITRTGNENKPFILTLEEPDRRYIRLHFAATNGATLNGLLFIRGNIKNTNLGYNPFNIIEKFGYTKAVSN